MKITTERLKNRGVIPCTRRSRTESAARQPRLWRNSARESGEVVREHVSQTNAKGCGEGMQRGEMNAGCGSSPQCRMQKRNAGFGRRGERRVGDGSREQNRVGRMAKPFPDAAFLFCILHWLEVPHSAFLFCILHRCELPYPAFISPPTLPLKGAGFARWPLALLRQILRYSARSASTGSMSAARRTGM